MSKSVSGSPLFRGLASEEQGGGGGGHKFGVAVHEPGNSRPGRGVTAAQGHREAPVGGFGLGTEHAGHSATGTDR